MKNLNEESRDWNYNFDLSAYDHRTVPELLSASRRNLCELIELVNRLFAHRSRVLVVRVDLGYRAHVRRVVPLELAQLHREKLLADRRYYPAAFYGLLGYAWCLEQGEEKGGYHYHLIAFYDGRLQKNDVGLGFAIKNLWDDQITCGFGNCSVINLDKSKFRKLGTLGIGMIHRDDFHMRKNLIELVLPYITKKSFFDKADLLKAGGGEFRTFGKSQLLAPIDPSVPRRGRRPNSGSW